MLKLCRVCSRRPAEHAGVCDTCRRRVLENSPVPTFRPGIWKLAGLLICLLCITSSLIAGAVVTHHTSLLRLPWTHTLRLENHLAASKTPVLYESTMVIEQATRKVYPYSIVPGGALDLDEAKRAMHDPSVKANYVDFDFARLRQVQLRTNLSGYVSYRWDEKIYWTSKMLTLRAGETVFTDGVHLVRGRCLNSFSAYPMLPTRPNEPTEKILDTPVEMPVIAYSFPKLPVEMPELPPPPGQLTPTVPVLPPASPLTPGKTGGGVWFPLLPIIPPIHRHPGQPPSLPPVPPPVVVVTPEPNFQWLLAGMFLLLVVLYGLRGPATALAPRVPGFLFGSAPKQSGPGLRGVR